MGKRRLDLHNGTRFVTDLVARRTCAVMVVTYTCPLERLTHPSEHDPPSPYVLTRGGGAGGVTGVLR